MSPGTGSLEEDRRFTFSSSIFSNLFVIFSEFFCLNSISNRSSLRLKLERTLELVSSISRFEFELNLYPHQLDCLQSLIEYCICHLFPYRL